MSSFEHAIFGNRGGSHQLLETSLVGQDSLLEELRFLVDRPVGYVGPEVVWSPYWGCGPLRDWWALWRGEEDSSAPRKNMVKSRVAMIRHKDVASVENLEELFLFLSSGPTANQGLPAGTVVDTLSRGVRPVVVPGISTGPALLHALWPRLWPAARRRLALRTLFGSETLDSGAVPDVVVIPTELRPRWRSHTLVDGDSEQPVTDAASWFSGAGAPELERLLRANWERLPGEFTVITRLERIARSAKALQDGRGGFADALLIVRTVEAFDEGLELPEEILGLLVAHVSEMRTAKITDIRAASLAKFTVVGESLLDVEEATSKWIQENLPAESDGDALWVLEHQAGSSHIPWWLRAVRKGLANAFANMTSDWAKAIWRWWTVNPEAVGWIQSLLPSKTEASLLSCLPSEMRVGLHGRVRALCVEHQWSKLLAGVLRLSEPLAEAVRVLRESVSDPESGLDVLVEQTAPGEIVAAAALCGWPPLIERAVHWTTRDAALFDGVDVDATGLLPLLAVHLTSGGALPSIVNKDGFVFRLFDGCIDKDSSCLDIVQRLGTRPAEAALRYSRQDALWGALEPARREPLLSATAMAWLNAFVTGKQMAKPGSVLAGAIRQAARVALSGGSFTRVLDYLIIFPEVSEREVVNWLDAEGFSWQDGDDERLADLLLAREWAVATKRFRWSWKSELKAVAWHARGLLSLWDSFWTTPPGVATDLSATTQYRSERRSSQMLRILFLAANPMNSGRLAIDEEARAIEEKVRAAKLRDAVEFRTKWAQRPGDLQQALLEEEPTVVHFSGHGGGTAGIVLHSEACGAESLVSSKALAHLFKVLKDNIRVVVLNACYSEEQAEAIVEEVDFVVGMADSIGDEAARVFAAAFYRGLAFGKSVQTAFDLGLNELKLMALKDDEDVPVLLTRAGADAASVTLVGAATL